MEIPYIMSNRLMLYDQEISYEVMELVMWNLKTLCKGSSAYLEKEGLMRLDVMRMSRALCGNMKCYVNTKILYRATKYYVEA